MDEVLLPLLDSLRANLTPALAATMGGTPCRVLIVPGRQVLPDWCSCDGDACGMAWVRLDRMYPSSVAFPAPDQRPTCNATLAAVIEVGAIRCAPLGDDEGNPPTPAEQTAAALTVADDARALVCALRIDEVTKREHVVGTWLPSMDQGDCTGGSITVTVQLRRIR